MKISTKISALILAGGIAFSNASFAQDEISDLVKSSPADATALTRAYLEPFFKGTGLGLNSGWAHTGTTKKLLRFDVKVGATLAMPPASAKTFDVTKIGLSNNFRPTGSNVVTPTIAGAEENGVEMGYYTTQNGKEYQITKFNLPQGLNVPMPGVQVQANVGLIKGIEAMIRFSPDIEPNKDFGKISMKGGGIKFQPFRLIPGGKKIAKLIPVDIAMAIGYNSIKYSYDKIDVQPEAGATPKPGTSPTAKFDDQKFEVEFSGLSVEAIASKKLLMFTPFVSVGYVTSNTKAGLYGDYPVTTGGIITPTPTPSNPNAYTVQKQYEIIKNPVNIDERFVSGLRAGAGLGINLFIFHLYASYNLAPYKYLNAGVSVGFGK